MLRGKGGGQECPPSSGVVTDWGGDDVALWLLDGRGGVLTAAARRWKRAGMIASLLVGSCSMMV